MSDIYILHSLDDADHLINNFYEKENLILTSHPSMRTQKLRISLNIVDIFFREIGTALSQKKRIEIRGFGSFYTKTREKRIGINPQNGKNIEIEKKVHPKFKMGKILFKKINPK